jgi:5-methyltetrahydrofolate--homocysteine methyltransferase
MDVLDLAASERCPVILSAVGPTGIPSNSSERVDNATHILEKAEERGMTADTLFVDLLVIPVAVDPDAGREYLDAVRALRSARPDIHITGGVSNVSFGLPARRVLNDVFLALTAEAGADSGIIDPVATDLPLVLQLKRSAEPARLAEAVLTGSDPFGGEYLSAYRKGRVTSIGTPARDGAPAAPDR